MTARPLRFALLAAALCPLQGVAAAADPGRKACMADVHRLCQPAMNSMSRRKVEACMIAHLDQTSPGCHDAMLRIKAERESAVRH